MKPFLNWHTKTSYWLTWAHRLKFIHTKRCFNMMSLMMPLINTPPILTPRTERSSVMVKVSCPSWKIYKPRPRFPKWQGCLAHGGCRKRFAITCSGYIRHEQRRLPKDNIVCLRLGKYVQKRSLFFNNKPVTFPPSYEYVMHIYIYRVHCLEIIIQLLIR